MDETPGVDGLRREYEAGRISADSYIAAGGDPDVVRDVEAERETAKSAEKAANERAGNRIVIGCVAIPVLLLGGCWAISSLGGTKATTPEKEKYGVTRVCEKAVKQQLKAPDSAQFDWDGVRPTTSTDGLFRYEGSGVVRAENSFGGTAVHTFDCTGTYTVSTGLAEARAVIS